MLLALFVVRTVSLSERAVAMMELKRLLIQAVASEWI